MAGDATSGCPGPLKNSPVCCVGRLSGRLEVIYAGCPMPEMRRDRKTSLYEGKTDTGMEVSAR